MSELTDRALVDLVIGGDAAARDAFERRYRNLIGGVIGRMRLQPSIAAFAAQQIWVNLLENDCRVLRRWLDSDSIAPFLARVVRNSAIDVLRTYGRRNRVLIPLDSDEDEPLPFPATGLGPLEVVSGKEQLERIQALAQELGPADQDLFWRRLVFEQSAPEIATDLGIQVNAVHVRLHRLRERFANVLEQHHPTLYQRLDRASRETE